MQVLATSRSTAFSTRATETGAGIQSLLYWCIPAAIAVGLLNKHWESKLRLFVDLALLGVLITSGNRSPLLLVVAAVAIRLLQGSRKHILALGLLTPVAVVVLSALSLWRGAVSSGRETGLYEAIRITVSDPVAIVFGSGFDTVEGLRLSAALADSGVRAPWWSPLMAIGNFIPRAVWPDKPQIFGSEIGQRHLGLSTSGIFLSGPGYGILLTGTVIGAAVVLAAFAIATRLAVQRLGHHLFVASVGLYLALRFVLAGDPFDVSNALQVALVYAGAYMVDRHRNVRDRHGNGDNHPLYR
ncbi:hypothetical protein GCM10027300_41460 [Modestobacter lapidis]